MNNLDFYGVSDLTNIGFTTEGYSKRFKGKKLVVPDTIRAYTESSTSATMVPSKGTSAPLSFDFARANTISAKEFVKFRKYFSLTQKQAADLLGISHSLVQKIEQSDVPSHRRDLVLKYYEFSELLKFFKTIEDEVLKVSLRVLHVRSPLFNNQTALEYAESLPKEDRIFIISAQLRRQFG